MSKHVTMASWDDVPHLSAQTKAELLASIPPWHRDARTKGIPQIGSGVIYPVPESEIAVEGFTIPPHGRRGYGMDCGGGAKPTAAVWGALDPETHVAYLYSAHKGSAAEPVIHATAIKARGEQLPGRADAAALIMTEHDTEQLLMTYQRLGLQIARADKGVETGIYEMWQLLSTGLLKVFRSLEPWFIEYRLYRRDAHGRIVKANDHLMDATRYLLKGGPGWWTALAPTGRVRRSRERFEGRPASGSPADLGWMR